MHIFDRLRSREGGSDAAESVPFMLGGDPQQLLARTVRIFDEFAKRIFDIVVSSVVICLLAPLFVLICFAIRSSDRGPALFRQVRVGRNGQRFKCWKFRSMVEDAGTALARHLANDPHAAEEWAASHKLAKDPRVTHIGSFLRKSSLDELPQIFNVLVGDMSLVGPRPITPDECSRYGTHLDRYLSVRPGITGLWQVSGRSDCSYPERVALDVRYVESRSFPSDIAILFRTVPAVLKQKGSC